MAEQQRPWTARRQFLREMMFGNEQQVTNYGYWLRGAGKDCSGEAGGIVYNTRKYMGGNITPTEVLHGVRDYARENPVIDEHERKPIKKLAWDVSEYLMARRDGKEDKVA